VGKTGSRPGKITVKTDDMMAVLFGIVASYGVNREKSQVEQKLSKVVNKFRRFV